MPRPDQVGRPVARVGLSRRNEPSATSAPSRGMTAAIAGDASTVEKSVHQLADAGVTDFIASIFGSREDRARTRELLISLR